MKHLSTFVKKLIRNRLGDFFAVAHLLLLLFIYFWAKDKEISSHNFYFQPWWLQLTAILDLPAMLISSLITFQIINKVISFTNELWVEVIAFFLFFVVSSIQWVLVGNIIWYMWKNNNHNFRGTTP